MSPPSFLAGQISFSSPGLCSPVPITLNSLVTGWYFGIFLFSSFRVVSCLLSSIVFTFSGQSSESAEVKPDGYKC